VAIRLMSATKHDRTATLLAIRSVMSRVFGVPEDSITEATRHVEIDRWDSLNMVMVAIGLERRLDRPIEPATLTGINSVAELLDILSSNGNAEA
jgi:acyl carrier protein